MTILSRVSLRIEVIEKIAQLRKQAEELRTIELEAVIQKIRKKVEEYGISATELKLSVSKTKKFSEAPASSKVARYRGPDGKV